MKSWKTNAQSCTEVCFISLKWISTTLAGLPNTYISHICFVKDLKDYCDNKNWQNVQSFFLDATEKWPDKHTEVLHKALLSVGGAEFFSRDHRKSSHPVDTCVGNIIGIILSHDNRMISTKKYLCTKQGNVDCNFLIFEYYWGKSVVQSYKFSLTRFILRAFEV